MTFKKILALALAALMLAGAMVITTSAAGSASFKVVGEYDYEAKTYTIDVVYTGDTALTVAYGIVFGNIDAEFAATATSSGTLPVDMGVAGGADGSVAGTDFYANDAYSTEGIAAGTVLATATISDVEVADYEEIVAELEDVSIYDLAKNVAGKYDDAQNKYIAILDAAGDPQDNATPMTFGGFEENTTVDVGVSYPTSSINLDYNTEAKFLEDYTFTVTQKAEGNVTVLFYTKGYETTVLEPVSGNLSTGATYKIPAEAVCDDLVLVVTNTALNIPPVITTVSGAIGNNTVNPVKVKIIRIDVATYTIVYEGDIEHVTNHLEEGTYEIVVEKQGYLTYTEEIIVAAGGADIVVEAELIPGDVDGDGNIDDDDTALLQEYAGTANSDYDINEDGIVNVWDMGYAVINYGK